MLRKKRTVFFILMITSAIIFHTGQMTHASEWQIVGPRALGMGGANVAVANDATASYWNPAAFGFFKGSKEDEYGKRNWSTTLAGVGLGVQLHGNIGDTLENVTDIDFEGLETGSITPTKVSDFVGLLSAIEEFRGSKNKLAIVTVNSRFSVQTGHFGIGALVFADITATPEFDFENIGPNTGAFTLSQFTDPTNFGCGTCGTASINVTTITTAQANSIDSQLQALGLSATQRNGFINAVDNGLTQSGVAVPSDIVNQVVNAATLANNASGSGPISQNTSTLRFKGIALVEVPLTYGRAFSENLAIGGNLKYMKARVYDVSIDILKQDFGDALDDALDNHQDKSNFGIDLGALYRLGDSIRVGIVGRNLNAPTFGSVKEEAQLRTGFAYQPSSFFTLAADIDLTENDTSVGSNLKSQNVGAGVELNLFKFIQLRGGLYKNLAESDIGLVYTAGIGVNLWVINIDIGAAISKDSTDLDGDSIPEEARAEFALSMLF